MSEARFYDLLNQPANCGWQLPKGNTHHSWCGSVTRVWVDRTPLDMDLPLCPTHLVDYIAIYGPVKVHL